MLTISTKSEIELKVGKKGDIYLKKEIQMKSGIFPEDHILLSIEDNKIIIRKKESYLDLARNAKIKYILTEEENEKLDKEINNELES